MYDQRDFISIERQVCKMVMKTSVLYRADLLLLQPVVVVKVDMNLVGSWTSRGNKPWSFGHAMLISANVDLTSVCV